MNWKIETLDAKGLILSAIDFAEKELSELPNINMMSIGDDDDTYQEALEISWAKQELRDKIDSLKKELEELGK